MIQFVKSRVGMKAVEEYGITIPEQIFLYDTVELCPIGSFGYLIPCGEPRFSARIEVLAQNFDLRYNIGFCFHDMVWRFFVWDPKTARGSFNTYQNDSVFYDDTNAILQQGDISFFKKLFRARRPKTVLELACGTNRIGNALLPYTEKMDGIDLSPDMLLYASQKTREANASFFRMDMRNLSLKKKFACIFCGFNSLQVLNRTDIPMFLSSLYGYMEPGGFAVIDIFNPKEEFLHAEERTEEKCVFPSHKMGGRLVRLVETTRYDEKERVNYISYTYQDVLTGQTWRGDYFMTQFAAEEMDLLVQEAGLHIEKKYGDYTMSKFTKLCNKQIYILRKGDDI